MVVKTVFFDPNKCVRGKMPIINELIVPQFANLGKSQACRVVSCFPCSAGFQPALSRRDGGATFKLGHYRLPMLQFDGPSHSHGLRVRCCSPIIHTLGCADRNSACGLLPEVTAIGGCTLLPPV